MVWDWSEIGLLDYIGVFRQKEIHLSLTSLDPIFSQTHAVYIYPVDQDGNMMWKCFPYYWPSTTSFVIQLFVQQLEQAYNKETWELHIT